MTQPLPLALTEVGVSLDGRPIVRDVSFGVAPGQVVAILGANGSGKSTLLKALVGLNPVAHGSVLLFGTPQSRFRDWGRVGYVPQRSHLGTGVPATVREVVASGRIARRRPLWPMSRHEHDLQLNAVIDHHRPRCSIRVLQFALIHHRVAVQRGGQQATTEGLRIRGSRFDLRVVQSGCDGWLQPERGAAQHSAHDGGGAYCEQCRSTPARQTCRARCAPCASPPVESGPERIAEAVP